MPAGLKHWRARLAVALVVGVAAIAAAQEVALPTLTDARLSTTLERARLVIDLSAPANFRFFSLGEPMRLVVEIETGGVGFDRGAHVPTGGLVADYRIGMIDATTARAVMTLSGPAKVQQAYVLEAAGDQPARLIVDLVPDTPAGFAAQVAAVAPEDVVPPAPPVPEAVSPEVVGPEAPMVPAAERPLIVIDPGHGGIDSGANTPDGILEKTIVLRFALDLQAILVATGKFDVALTRDSDEFMALEQRVALARRNHADLLVSLHADSFDQPQVRGAAIYTRDETATDVLAKVLAEQENKVDLLAGFNAPVEDAAVVDILVDLMRTESRRRAFRAALAIVDELERSVELRRFPLRRADFFVLQAPEIPSILVELGFLSNPDDTLNLSDEAWRLEVAEAVARGIGHYFDGER
ncbi:MAG: N-acetylmuramoyl-L-alanine amidase [Cucumibacter sp.]